MAQTIDAALDDLQWIERHVRRAHPHVRVGFDLADMSGYAYYSGVRFALYGAGASDSLVRGGRYDEVGAVFGRNRVEQRGLGGVGRPVRVGTGLR